MKAEVVFSFINVGGARLIPGNIVEVDEDRFKKLRRSGFVKAIEQPVEEVAVEQPEIETATDEPKEYAGSKKQGRNRRSRG